MNTVKKTATAVADTPSSASPPERDILDPATCARVRPDRAMPARVTIIRVSASRPTTLNSIPDIINHTDRVKLDSATSPAASTAAAAAGRPASDR